MRILSRFLFGLVSILPIAASLHADIALPVPAGATARIGALQLRVQPDHADWTYALGEAVRFRISVMIDQQPVEGVTVQYSFGPEMQPADTKSVVVPIDGLEIDAGTLAQPGFLRCIASVDYHRRSYRALATAGVAPDQIKPTQQEPADFDAFWERGKQALARMPLDARLVLMPEASTSEVNVYHVSFRTFGSENAREYGILCEPTTPGEYPAILRLPGAGVGPIAGGRDTARRGAIVLDMGIHGIAVNLPREYYEQLRSAALDGYPLFNLQNKESYYYRRVYLSCLRANDLLVSRPMWDHSHLLTMGGSQGGQLTVATAALDPRVTAAAASFPAYCDVTGELHRRAGGWPHMFRDEVHRTPQEIETTAYFDVVNFARRLKVPMYFSWGYNDETCPPTSMFAAYNVVTAPKELALKLDMGHMPVAEQVGAADEWIMIQAGRIQRPANRGGAATTH